MKQALVPMIVAATALAAASGAMAAEQQWQSAGSIGMRRFVVVNPAAAADTGVLKQAAEGVCMPGKPCMVMFWAEASAVPQAMPMTRDQQKAVVAQYLRNPTTGNEELLLKCREGDSQATKCLR